MIPSAVLRRCAGAAVTVLVTGGVALGGGTAVPAAAAQPAASTGSAQIAAQVRALDREVRRVGVALTAGVERYEQAQDRLAVLTQDRMAARDDAEARQADATASRAASDRLARAAYKGTVPPLVAALLSGDPRTVSDLVYVQRSVSALGTERADQAERAERRERTAGRVLAQSDAERRQAVVQRQVVAGQLADLRAQTARLSERLAVTADALAAARADEAARARAAARAREAAAARAAAARAAAGGSGTARPSVPDLVLAPAPDGTCGPPSTFGEANGFLPASTLCPLSVGRGHRLRTDAARAFERLRVAYASSLGRPLCVTDSYRSYAAQVDVFARKPSLAAVPGTSQHGWGLALDLCGGVQVFGSEAHEWMLAHAPAHGWVHPRWARQDGSRPEPWHWEYTAG